MNKDKLTSLLFLILGIGLILPSIIFSFNTIKILTTYQATKGILIDFYEKEKEDKKTGTTYILYAPIYEYFDKRGNRYTINSGSYTNMTSLINKESKIYYDENFPQLAVTSSFQLYGIPLISIFFCVVCLITAYIVKKSPII